jgi:hypothetical protein
LAFAVVAFASDVGDVLQRASKVRQTENLRAAHADAAIAAQISELRTLPTAWERACKLFEDYENDILAFPGPTRDGDAVDNLTKVEQLVRRMEPGRFAWRFPSSKGYVRVPLSKDRTFTYVAETFRRLKKRFTRSIDKLILDL